MHFKFAGGQKYWVLAHKTGVAKIKKGEEDVRIADVVEETSVFHGKQVRATF